MIVVYTPYGRSEATAAAIRLAELAVAAALPARLVSVGPHEARVHPFWDRHVLSGRDGGVQAGAAGATVCVWFVYGEYARRSAAKAAPKAAHVYVPSWHGQPRPGTEGVPPYEQIVCPSRHHHASFVNRVMPAGHENTHVTWARWDAGFPPVRHEGRAEPNKIRVLANCDVGAIDECPAVTLRIMEGIVERCEQVELTCWSTKSWARRDRRKLVEMEHTFAGRFRTVRGGDLQGQLTLMHEHDWFLYPAARCDFALHPVRALHCGLPVLGWDVPPLSEQVATGHNGVLVPCELSANWCNAPVAAAQAARFVDAVVPYLADARQLFAMQGTDWALKARSEAFQQFWLDLFGAGDR